MFKTSEQRKVWGKSAQELAQTSAIQKSAQVSAHHKETQKLAHRKQHDNRALKSGVKVPSLRMMTAERMFGCTPSGLVRQRNLLREASRDCFEKVLRRALRLLVGGRALRRAISLRRGIQEGKWKAETCLFERMREPTTLTCALNLFQSPKISAIYFAKPPTNKYH